MEKINLNLDLNIQKAEIATVIRELQNVKDVLDFSQLMLDRTQKEKDIAIKYLETTWEEWSINSIIEEINFYRESKDKNLLIDIAVKCLYLKVN